MPSSIYLKKFHDAVYGSFRCDALPLKFAPHAETGLLELQANAHLSAVFKAWLLGFGELVEAEVPTQLTVPLLPELP